MNSVLRLPGYGSWGRARTGSWLRTNWRAPTVLAAEVGEGALLDLAVVAIGLDDADILVDRATGGPDFDGSEVHVVKYHDKYRRNQGQIPMIPANLRLMLSLRFSGKNAGGRSKNLGK